MALRDFFYIQAYISVSVCIISISVANLTEAGKVNKTKRSPNEEETTPQNSSKFKTKYLITHWGKTTFFVQLLKMIQ